MLFEKLAIELDGEVHFNERAAQYDYERKLFVDFLGIKILRFENKAVFASPEFVIDRIESNFGWNKGLAKTEWVDW